MDAEPTTSSDGGSSLDRREFLRLGAAAAAVPAFAGIGGRPSAAVGPSAHAVPDIDIAEATIAELQAEMEAGRLSSLVLVRRYLNRIGAVDRDGPRLNSILELNPDAEDIAHELDGERRQGHVRGPLHGIPIVLKDNIGTADGMMTTAGSLALVGSAPAQDATTAALLREAGAVLLGKAGLSEWANFRSFHSSSGWSGRGGQVRNPYVLDRNPCGSSSGSGAAPSANLCAAAVGTETDGSIVCPATANGVVGLKPTLGVTSRAGVVPIAHSQDTVGPHARTVADAAAMLGGMASTVPDPRDPATSEHRDLVFSDYTQFLDPNGLAGARIGVARAGVSGYSEETDAVFEAAVAAMQAAGAVVIDPADIPTIDQINAGAEEVTVLVYEFKRDLNAYLATRSGVPIATLADAIAFNEAHADEELKWFGQEWFELAESDPFSEAEYLAALAEARRLGGQDGIDAVLEEFELDAIVAPTGSPPWTTDLVNGDHFQGASSSPAAIAGYPLVSVPAGEAFGLPVGITFMGTAYSEPTLIRVAHGFEQTTLARRRPEFLPTLPTGARRTGQASRRAPRAATRPMICHL
ncbi:MAG: amidase [Acidimicrobiales bacterium]